MEDGKQWNLGPFLSLFGAASSSIKRRARPSDPEAPLQFENCRVQKDPEDLWPPTSHPLNLGRDAEPSWSGNVGSEDPKPQPAQKSPHDAAAPSPPLGFHRSASQTHPGRAVFGSQPLPTVWAHTPSRASLLIRATRGPCSPLPRQRPSSRATSAGAATATLHSLRQNCVYSRHGNGPFPQIPEVSG